jgi:predicted acetyltransferase
MDKIKRIPRKDIDYFADIFANAYPGFGLVTTEQKEKFKKRTLKIQRQDPCVSTHGYYRDGRLIGIMMFYDFVMTFFSTRTLVGGVGQVAVDLAFKRERVCKEMMDYFLHHYRKKKACLTALTPFRPDFYKKMGFGYGAKLCQYSFEPASLPRGGSKKHIQFLGKKDYRAMTACYNRYAEKTHGMIQKHEFELIRYDRPEIKIIGYKEKNSLLGYIVFSFKSAGADNPLLNNLHIREFIYRNRSVFLELLTFLHTQSDQINRITYGVQDDMFHYLLHDPRDSSDRIMTPLGHQTNTQGIGIMYRVIDTTRLFDLLKDNNFGNQTCRLKLTINDSFLKENDGSHIVHFYDGRPQLKKSAEYDAEIRLDVSDFSSMVIGAVNFKSLYDFGLAEISNDKYIDIVNTIFAAKEKPKTTTQF